VADTLGAAIGIDDVDGISLFDRFVGTFVPARVARDAVVGNHQCHTNTFFELFRLFRMGNVRDL
jgi:hypothetical protein